MPHSPSQISTSQHFIQYNALPTHRKKKSMFLSLSQLKNLSLLLLFPNPLTLNSPKWLQILMTSVSKDVSVIVVTSWDTNWKKKIIENLRYILSQRKIELNFTNEIINLDQIATKPYPWKQRRQVYIHRSTNVEKLTLPTSIVTAIVYRRNA